jgi:hypothetical protein
MASISNASITFDTEPIVKLQCTADSCRFNLLRHPVSRYAGAYCELKHIEIDENGKCRFFEVRKEAT